VTRWLVISTGTEQTLPQQLRMNTPIWHPVSYNGLRLQAWQRQLTAKA
jgi:hypothetical protein